MKLQPLQALTFTGVSVVARSSVSSTLTAGVLEGLPEAAILRNIASMPLPLGMVASHPLYAGRQRWSWTRVVRPRVDAALSTVTHHHRNKDGECVFQTFVSTFVRQQIFLLGFYAEDWTAFASFVSRCIVSYDHRTR